MGFLNVLIAALLSASSVHAQKVCSISNHGASTSSADNAKAIQAALDECATGGVITISGGAFKSGPLTVGPGRDMNVVLQTGATLETAFGPDKWPQSGDNYIDVLVFDNCMNCTLTGGGTMWGRGGRPDGPNGGDDWYYLFDEGKIKPGRPHYLRIQNCIDFTLRSGDAAGGRLTILDAPKFNCVIDNSSSVEIDGLNITSTWYMDPSSGELKEPHNTDGIDPGSNSHHIHIHNVHISNGDDSIAIKPSHSPGCTHDILVENSFFTHGHGCSIGSVGSGCVRNIIFRNITMREQQNGCRVKTYITSKPGVVHNITWEDITMVSVDKCITVNANYKPPPSHSTTFVSVSGLTFANIKGTNCGSSSIFSASIMNESTMSNAPAEFTCPRQSPCTEITLTNVDLTGKTSKDTCEYAFGEAHGTVVPPSCLLAPGPAPAPTPPSPTPPTPTPPTPTPPSPSPAGCDVDACIARCVTKYGGAVSDQKDAYHCAKACAGLKDGKVSTILFPLSLSFSLSLSLSLLPLPPSSPPSLFSRARSALTPPLSRCVSLFAFSFARWRIRTSSARSLRGRADSRRARTTAQAHLGAPLVWRSASMAAAIGTRGSR